jgi:hypothetical protein
MLTLYWGYFGPRKDVRYWGKRGAWFTHYDALPEEVQNALAMLNLVGIAEEVEGVGIRSPANTIHLYGFHESFLDNFNSFEETDE